jgi:3-oxoacyl-[acyl-carrier-protein] synthase-1
MSSHRVVITGVGVVAPNGIGKTQFLESLKKGFSGIKHIKELEDLNFSCQVAGIPNVTDELKSQYFDDLTIKNLKSTGIIYGSIAGIDAWKDAGLSLNDQEPDWDSGCIFGSGLSGVEPLRDSIYMVDAGKVRRLGSRVVEQTMASGISAYLGGMIGLGNQVTSNSSACSTGTEALILAYEKIKLGKAKRMLAGSCDSQGPYIWGGFDSMRVLNRTSNDKPEEASRPMSVSAAGFVPGAGAGALVLESLESAKERGATIYAEVIGGAINSGGQKQGGTMTAPNPLGVQKCIEAAIKDADISAYQIDGISGHLTSTMGDVIEISNWSKALNRKGEDFPQVNSLKSMIGHCLAAAGSIECVAVALQLKENFFHGTLNCDELHPEIAEKINADKVNSVAIDSSNFDIIAKSSFGFGDVNCCVVLQRFKQ